MIFSRRVLFLFALIGISILGCRSTDITETTRENSPRDTVQSFGIITGTVVNFSQISGQGPIDGVKIEIDSTAFFAVTDTSGKFLLVAPFGTHVLHFTKEGFGEMRLFGIVHFAPDTTNIGDVWLGEKPSQELIDMTSDTSDPSGKTVTFRGMTTPHSLDDRAHVETLFKLYSKSPSGSNIIEEGSIVGMGVQHNGDFIAQLGFADIVKVSHFIPGDTLYITLQLVNRRFADPYEIGFYTDPFTEQIHYTAVSTPTPPLKIIMR